MTSRTNHMTTADTKVELILKLEARLDEVEQMIPMAAAAEADEHDDLEWERTDLMNEIANLRARPA